MSVVYISLAEFMTALFFLGKVFNITLYRNTQCHWYSHCDWRL